MKKLCVSILLSILVNIDGAPQCYNGWATYKDELCIKAFNEILTYEEARSFCISQGDEMSSASLVTVKEADVQEFLANYTETIFDYVWLGAKYDTELSQFRWEDGEKVVYSNWGEGFPRNISDDDACIELRPLEIKTSSNVRAKWAHVTCRKRNLVICQKALPWSLQDAVQELIKVRKQLADAHKKIGSQGEELVGVRNELSQVGSRVIPVGSVYVEYYNQPSPASIWPDLTWEEITGTYAGLFFRAVGGSSEPWGSIQDQCAPRVTDVSYHAQRDGHFPNPVHFPGNGWSEFVDAGESGRYGTPELFEGLRFHTGDCEVRPRNQAIRIWKRIA